MLKGLQVYDVIKLLALFIGQHLSLLIVLFPLVEQLEVKIKTLETFLVPADGQIGQLVDHTRTKLVEKNLRHVAESFPLKFNEVVL